jgi:hypothetical protein
MAEAVIGFIDRMSGTEAYAFDGGGDNKEV